jgi:RNA polymerase sigma-70 factor (ECF subfamily)
MRPIQKTDAPHLPGGRAATSVCQEAAAGAGGGPLPAALAAFCASEERLGTLIQAIARGDAQALATLYDATSALVYGLALRIVRDPSAAEDVVIEVYMQVQRLAPAYEPARGTPSGWLLTLTRSRAIDRFRVESLRQQREAPLEIATSVPALTPDPEAASTATELQRAVRTALLALSPEQRQVIEIAYYAGLSHSEIAARLQQPLGTVKTRLRTGMMVLRTHLSAFFEVPQP